MSCSRTPPSLADHRACVLSVRVPLLLTRWFSGSRPATTGIGDIWAPRAAESGCGDFFDSEITYKKRFDQEWNEQRDLFSDKAKDDADAMGDMASAMWEFDDLMLVIFDYYASLGSDGRISSMTFNEWTMFYQDYHLHKNNQSLKAELDRVFIAVDTKASHVFKAAKAAAEQQGRRIDSDADEKKALKRPEFCTALVTVATLKFLKTNMVSNVADAFRKLMLEVIEPLVDYDKLPDPNLFRRFCYVFAVSNELMKANSSLRILHKALSEYEFGKGAKRLGPRGWRDALRAFNFLGMDISERDCTLCFVWSRMASSSPSVADDRLPFESFLEALCRLASIKALPTDEEMAAKGCEDAGKYVQLMLSEEDTRKEYEDMLRARRIGWGGKPTLPLETCVRHTISIISRAIEATCQRGKVGPVDEGDGALSEAEIATWVKRDLLKQDSA